MARYEITIGMVSAGFWGDRTEVMNEAPETSKQYPQRLVRVWDGSDIIAWYRNGMEIVND